MAKRDPESNAQARKDRMDNPAGAPVMLDTDPEAGPGREVHDPQLSRAEKAEHTSFQVTSVSLPLHERIDPRTVIEAVFERNGIAQHLWLFAEPDENPTLRQANEFCSHPLSWPNRLIAGDSINLPRISSQDPASMTRWPSVSVGESHANRVLQL